MVIPQNVVCNIGKIQTPAAGITPTITTAVTTININWGVGEGLLLWGSKR